jgi:hypothetical protein
LRKKDPNYGLWNHTKVSSCPSLPHEPHVSSSLIPSQFGFCFALPSHGCNNTFIAHQRQCFFRVQLIKDISRRYLWQLNIQTTKAHKM